MIKIDLIHPWTRELVSHAIKTVTTASVFFRWGMNGFYCLNLKSGKITACEKRIRLRGKVVLWEALDLSLLRKQVKQELARIEAEHATHKAPLDVYSAMKRHEATMPKGNGDVR